MYKFNIFNRFKAYIGVKLKPFGKGGFIKTIVKNGKLLDVGCGNNSPSVIKQKRPDINYTGIDIDVYSQESGYEKYADRLIFTNPDNFHLEIEKFTNEFDSIICSHNLEHCFNYNAVLLAMLGALKSNGKIYLAFPCEKSVTFPKRKNSLNFYDDVTHINLINYDDIIAKLAQNNVIIDFAVRQYKPLILAVIGFLFEPIGRIFNMQAPWQATWALYGFETIIIGHKV
ncbi:MAG TPA: class I SAM-dependent methyltransferase, partial [Ignavibacteria bacterium]|nr:class I SAM-dependent methyltransferase [Ignavibacteria bacterium]